MQPFTEPYGAMIVQVWVTGVVCSATAVTTGASQIMYENTSCADTTRRPAGTSTVSVPAAPLVPDATIVPLWLTSTVREVG